MAFDTEFGAVDGDTRALRAAMTVAPPPGRLWVIDQTIRQLKQHGIWQKLDVFWMLAAHDAQAARLNWKAPGTFTLTAVNSPTFTADRGYAGNGTTSYLNTGWNPSTNAVQTQQNNSHVMNWTRNVYASGDRTDIGCYTSVGLLNCSRLSLAGKATFQSTSATPPAQFASTTAGMTVGVGRSGPAQEIYENGLSLATDADATSALPNAVAFICALNFSGSAAQHTTRQQAAGSFGAAFSSAEVASYSAIIRNHMNRIGA